MNIAFYIVSFLLLGVIAGGFSGLLGIGGGILMVPAMVYLFGLTQHEAQGTTLALMVPPISLLAAWTYHKHGHVDLKVAALVCVGFFFGSLYGARLATSLDAHLLKRLFGFAMLVISIRMILTK